MVSTARLQVAVCCVASTHVVVGELEGRVDCNGVRRVTVSPWGRGRGVGLGFDPQFLWTTTLSNVTVEGGRKGWRLKHTFIYQTEHLRILFLLLLPLISLLSFILFFLWC